MRDGSSKARCLPRLLLGSGLALAAVLGAGACSDTGAGGDGCVTTRTFFAQNVWSSFMSTKCTRCHTPDGVAVTEHNAKLVLEPSSYPGFMDANLATLKEVSKIQYESKSELLLKPLGKMNHGGGVQLQEDSPEYRALTELVERLGNEEGCVEPPNGVLTYVHTLDSAATLRKASLGLVGRLPTPAERDAVQKGGEPALDKALDAMMKEDAFYERLREIFNDILLTDRFLSYDGHAIDFMNEEDYPALAPYRNDQSPLYQDRWRVNMAIAREPLALINYVVRKDKPFTEILTANYAVVNPFLAAAYGITNLPFQNPADPNEFLETQVVTGKGIPIPHAGVLSTPSFLNRWQTTPTNRDRGRARRLFQFFLATDVLKLAERPIDATKVTAEQNPAMNSDLCTTCHKVLDPVAGGFRNYHDEDYEHFEPDGAWHDDMFEPGFGAESMDPAYYKRALQWLGAQMANDPRFAIGAVYTAFKGFTGHDPLPYPSDSQAPDFRASLAAWSAQDAFFRETAAKFNKQGKNFKVIVKAVIESPYYRAVSGDPRDPAGQMGLGTGRLLTPEMLNRKITAITGYHWRIPADWENQHDWLLENYRMLYGGIDSFDVPTRLTIPNSIIASVGLVMANEMACGLTAYDFTHPKPERRLFPMVDPGEVPESAGHTVDGSVANIKKNIRHLHDLLLGEPLELDDPEIERTYQLFLDTWRELSAAGDHGIVDACKGVWDPATGQELPEDQRVRDDPNFTVRSWMAVMSYLLADYRFLHE